MQVSIDISLEELKTLLIKQLSKKTLMKRYFMQDKGKMTLMASTSENETAEKITAFQIKLDIN